MNPMDVKRGIDAAVDVVKQNLVSSAKKLKTVMRLPKLELFLQMVTKKLEA